MSLASRLWKKLTGGSLPLKRLLIMNPASRNGRASKAFNKLYPALKAKLGDFELHMTTSPMDATNRVRQALKNKECYQILVAGGDGTINEAVNGYFEKGKVVRKDIPLGVINLGTGGDFFRSIQQINASYDVAIRENCFRLVDCGLVTINGGEQRYFLNIASTGMGGEVLKSLKKSAFQTGTPAFFYHSLKTLIKYIPPMVKIKSLDPSGNWSELDVELVNFFACNGRFNGGGMNWAPNGIIDDGIFNIVVVARTGKLKLIAQSGKIYAGRISELSGVREFEARHVIIEHSGELSLELDGEIMDMNHGNNNTIHFELKNKVFPLIL